MKAIKGNRQYEIAEAEKQQYINSGFDIVDNAGKILAYGKGKTVPYEEYAKMKVEIDALREKLDADKKVEETKSLKDKKKSENSQTNGE